MNAGMKSKQAMNHFIHWDDDSTYIQNPPFFEGLSPEPEEVKPLNGLRVVGKFGDSVTTDHISPAGAIGKDTPAGNIYVKKALNHVTLTLTVLVVVTMKS